MAGAALPPGTIIDITRPIGPGTPVWPGDPPVEIEPVARLAAGDPAAVSRLALGTHTGTHVDPPAHFFENGVTVDALPLPALVGPAVVVDLSPAPGPVDGPTLAQLVPEATERLLVKTGGTDGVVTADAARWLVERGLRLVGVDTLSIEPATDRPGVRGCPPEESYPVHRTLLAAGVVIVEGLDLSAVPAGRYQLLCLPLRIAGGDGAPARAVLITGAGQP